MTNIAKKALAIAKEKEIERLETCKREVHYAINIGFQKLLHEFTYFTGTYGFDFSQVFSGTGSEIIAVCESIGFATMRNPEKKDGYILSAPVITKEQEATATEAQKMILQHNEKVKVRRELEEKRAEEMCEKIATKIAIGKFRSGKSQDLSNAYEIQVETEDYAESSEVLIDKAKHILEEMGFFNISTLGKGYEWILNVYDED